MTVTYFDAITPGQKDYTSALTKIGDRMVRNAAELTVAVRLYDIGATVPVVLARQGRQMTIQVTLQSDLPGCNPATVTKAADPAPKLPCGVVSAALLKAVALAT